MELKTIETLERNPKLTVRQKRILSMIRENHKISASKIAEILSITSRTTQWDLTVLREKNIIKRVGPDKGGYWEILINNENTFKDEGWL